MDRALTCNFRIIFWRVEVNVFNGAYSNRGLTLWTFQRPAIQTQSPCTNTGWRSAMIERCRLGRIWIQWKCLGISFRGYA